MRVEPGEYQKIDLRVHDFLADVPLHDVWAVDLPGGAERRLADLRALVSLEQIAMTNRHVAFLFWLRAQLGRVFGLDREPRGSAGIPASSYLHRLTEADRAATLVEPGTSSGLFRVVYQLPHEQVEEIVNATVHAFSVFALVPRPQGQRLYWAIYVQPIGWQTAWYMRLIDPFRRFIIYPAVLRGIRTAWIGRAERDG